MGTIKYLTLIREFCKKTPVVTVSSLRKFIGKKSTYIYPLLSNMVRHGELHRLTKGFYSVHQDPVLIVFCFKPAYLGLQEAMSIHNLWEQETNGIVLTTNIAREGLRSIGKANVLIKRIPRSLFFGVEYKQYGDFYVPVSDKEKTFLDMLYFKQPLDKEVIRQWKRRIDRKKLTSYLGHYPHSLKEAVQRTLSS